MGSGDRDEEGGARGDQAREKEKGWASPCKGLDRETLKTEPQRIKTTALKKSTAERGTATRCKSDGETLETEHWAQTDSTKCLFFPEEKEPF